MSETGTRSRRDLITTVAGGALLGAMWGAAFPVVASEHRPSLAVVGHRNAQVILIDSSSARVLLLSGEPEQRLLDRVPAMMTVFRQRIDLLIATPEALVANARNLSDRWRIRHAIALADSTASASVVPSTTAVADGVNIALDESMSLDIRMGHRNEWRADVNTGSSRMWCATLRTSAGDIVVAPDAASIAAIGPSASSLMIVPNVPDPEVFAISPVSTLATNYDSDSIDSEQESTFALTRIYPMDVTRFVIGRDGLELPEWTRVPHSEDER